MFKFNKRVKKLLNGLKLIKIDIKLIYLIINLCSKPLMPSRYNLIIPLQKKEKSPLNLANI